MHLKELNFQRENNMAFLEKIKNIATGRTEPERKQIAVANVEIRKRALAAELREREKQTVRISEERVRVKAQEQLKKIRSGGSFLGPVPGGAYGSPFGKPRQLAPRPNVISTKRKRKKGKKKRSKNYQPMSITQPKRYDPIFGGYR